MQAECSLVHFGAAGFWEMAMIERTVKVRIAELERVLLQLNDELMQEDDVRVRNALESRVRATDQALEDFLTDLQVKQKVRDAA